ncbi:hypothetical protein BN2537_16997 [Streptomyces venezuelae]|nr:hypothetical protein BN2537_16997 [Streptomyces venezuelae]
MPCRAHLDRLSVHAISPPIAEVYVPAVNGLSCRGSAQAAPDRCLGVA